jgi:hypothetical protein
MDYQNLTIVCYAGGCCGDLVSAMIDSTGCSTAGSTTVLSTDRMRLKKPHLFTDDTEKNNYLIEMSSKYTSIPSHDLDYHVKNKHNFLGIGVKDTKLALWAADRFKTLHRPMVWNEMTKFCGANSIESYAQVMLDFTNLMEKHASHMVYLNDIQNGSIVEKLMNYTEKNINSSLYNSWLEKQKI